MRLQQDSNFTTLSWVKPELDETLRLARQALEAHAENGADRNQMQVCAAQLHQVQGTLRMVELYGAAMVAEEMEHLANALLEEKVADREEGYGALMRSIMQLPDYLERLQSGHKDIPMVLLPLLNDLRGARGEKGVAESVLFTADVSRTLPPSARGPLAPVPDAQLRSEAEALRGNYQAALLKWLRDDESPENMSALADVCTKLVGLTQAEPPRKLFWVAAGTLDALRAGAFVASKPLKQALAKVEREIKRLADDGESAFDTAPPSELTRQLLYYVANAPTENDRITEIREVFGLEVQRHNESELAHARGSLTGHNRELLDTVSTGIKEDLLRVKEALDMHLRTAGAPVSGLAPQAEALGAIADTLGMLGLGIPRQVVQDQRTAIQALASGQRNADENALLDIAGALLYVEASLDDQVARLGQSTDAQSQETASTLPAHESQQALDALVKESVANFVQARQCFVAFIEAGWDHAQLHDVPRLLDEVSGAMHLLEQLRAARQLHALSVFTQIELVQRQRVPDAMQMDRLADALASLEYYLEALRDHRPQRERILELAEHGLVALGYWPVPAAAEQSLLDAARGTAAPPVAPTQPEPVVSAAVGAEASARPVVEAAGAPATPEQTPSAQPAPAAAAAIPTGVYGFSENAEIDDDIREVFIEELEEEIANLRGLYAEWSLAPNSGDTLRSLRRVFHTLKGSGRLVGALGLGEFSWKVENMLNRVLDGSRPASPEVIALVGHAADALPQFQAALTGQGTVTADIEGMQVVADRLGAGEEVMFTPSVALAAIEPAVVAEPEHVEVEPVEAEPVEAVESVEVPAPAMPVEEEVVPEGAAYASIDPVLMEILRTEVASHLQTIQQWSDAAAFTPQPATDALRRAVHTISGAFAMTEVPHITDVLSPTEGYIRRLLAHNEWPSATGVALLGDVAHAIADVLSALEKPRPMIAPQVALAERAVALRDALPELAAPSLPVHLEEAEQALPVAAEIVEPAVPSFEPDAEAIAAFAVGETEPQAHEEVAPAATVDTDAADAVSATESTSLDAETPAPEEPAHAAADVAAAAEAERLEAERLEYERLEAEYAEADRVATEQRAEAERVEAGRVEAERVAAEQAEAERIETERVAAEHAEAERVAAEQAETERVEAERVAAEQAEAERIETERVAAERAEIERADAERVAAERAEAERAATEFAKAEAERARAAAQKAAAAAQAAKSRRTPKPAIAVVSGGIDVDPEGPLDLTDIDPELLDIFIEETTDILDHSDGLLTRLREAPSEREPVVSLQRDLHTLKGGARMAGMMSMGELAHAMESVLEASAEFRLELGAQGLGILERGFDRLHGMLARIQQRQAVGLPEHLITEFNALARGEIMPASEPADTTEAAAEAPSDAVAETPVTRVKPAPKPSLKPLSAPVDTTLDEDEDIGVRAPQEQVRIRADLLDRLVNYAGEVAIYRARLEQQLGGFRGHLDELEQTTIRLRQQLRKLEIETDAQIMARYQRADDAEQDFDPLELDRFSTQQQLTRALAESAADLVSLHVSLDDVTRQYETLLLQQSRVSSDLQDGLMRTRMVPFDALVPRLRRVLRQAATETGKQVQLKVEGAQGEMDRNVLDRMTAPLEHMLRNSVVHGLETPADRRSASKHDEGTVTVSMRREGSEVVMVVADDGRGLNRDAIRQKAIERGLLKADMEVGDATLYAFILESGFSTADTVSRLAGRGVGMDVVHNEIRQLGGSLQLTSTAGKGTQFTIRLPFTLAVTQAALVKIGETSFAVPISSVQGVGRISRTDLEKQLASEHPVYVYAGEEYEIHDLGRLLGGAPAKAQGSLQMPLLLSRSGDVRAAICVDEVQGSREIVVKPVGPQVSSVPGIFGATIMGDGGVMVILDVVPLVRRHAAQELLGVPVEAAPAQEVRRVPLVMVVDDSITMRKVTGRVLERNNMEVLAAKDGIDAIEKMVERVPDLMLLDIEMPRMDGYELATHMRNDPRLRDVPIVMITSRTGEKHRQRAFEIGVNRYLGKPYQEAELMRNVFDLLTTVRQDG
jgi:chemosensory pili system protein ChpA (sensor histidine kinase/response regulator)